MDDLANHGCCRTGSLQVGVLDVTSASRCLSATPATWRVLLLYSSPGRVQPEEKGEVNKRCRTRVRRVIVTIQPDHEWYSFCPRPAAWASGMDRLVAGAADDEGLARRAAIRLARQVVAASLWGSGP